MSTTPARFIRWFGLIGLADVPLVGGKTASLGELYHELTQQGVRVPDGFAVTAQAYRHVLQQADALPRLHHLLDGVDGKDVQLLAERAAQARDIVPAAGLPADLRGVDFDERDPGVLAFLAQAIEGARRNPRHVGICGQAPSDYPEVAAFVVERGIDALSVTPDTLLKVTGVVLAVERHLGRPPRTEAP